MNGPMIGQIIQIKTINTPSPSSTESRDMDIDIDLDILQVKTTNIYDTIQEQCEQIMKNDAEFATSTSISPRSSQMEGIKYARSETREHQFTKNGNIRKIIYNEPLTKNDFEMLNQVYSPEKIERKRKSTVVEPEPCTTRTTQELETPEFNRVFYYSIRPNVNKWIIDERIREQLAIDFTMRITKDGIQPHWLLHYNNTS